MRDPLPVLVVDDDPHLLRTLGDILELRGYRPLTAGSGETGLHMAEEAGQELAIALVDLRLPDMDGIELVGRLHTLSELTEVVILTGHASLDSAVAALRNESFDYLVKPVEPRKLLETVQRASERWQRRLVERKLAETEERFRLLVENISDMIFVTDRDGTVRYVSPSIRRVLSVEPAALHGSSLAEHVHPDDRASLAELLGSMGGGSDGVVACEHRLRAADGLWRPVESTLHDLLGHPEVRGVVIAARDVAERKELEAQLLHSQKMESVGRLAGGVAHDFNNLLTVILGSVGYALEQIPSGSGLREPLDETLEAARRAADLTRQLLAFSRQQILEPTLLDPNELVRSTEKLLLRVIGEDVELHTVLATDPGHVRADPTQLQQVLMNLAVNARDAMPSGGRLTIRTARGREEGQGSGEPAGGDVVIEVSDTGHGIPPELHDRVFEPFFTTKEVGKGTGLGLATVLGIVEQSGGSVLVSSVPGSGTTFTIRLPRSDDVDEDGPGDEVSGELPAGSETILLVEDEAMLRGLVASALRRFGYEVLDVADGEAALKLLSDGRHVDLLLSDMVLPGMSGVELAERLGERWPDVDVVFMTGWAGEVVGREGGDVRFPVLQKPFTIDEVVRRLRAVLDG